MALNGFFMNEIRCGNDLTCVPPVRNSILRLKLYICISKRSTIYYDIKTAAGKAYQTNLHAK